MNRDTIIFICSPLINDINVSIDNAKKFCRWTMLTDKSNIAFSPLVFFTNFLNITDPYEKNIVFAGSSEILKGCDEVFIFKTDNIITEDMKEYIDLAREYGKKTLYIDDKTIKEILK